MRKQLMLLIGMALAAGTLAASAVAEPAPPSVAPMPVGGKMAVFVAADTVFAPTSTSGYKAELPYAQTNFFPRGSAVLFRTWAIDIKTGKVLTPTDVKYAYVNIPGQSPLKLSYGKLGTAASAPTLWTATWNVSPTQALGVVPFRIHFRTKANTYGLFYQVPVPNAQLQIIPAS